MEKFQIRYFRGETLEKVEALEAPDLLEVIDRTNPRREVTAEIWSKIGKVGTIGPAPDHFEGRHEGSTGEAQIAELMKRRLRLVRR